MNILWKSRKHHFGLPLSFTEYSLSEDRLFLKTGFLNITKDEVMLFRVRDFKVKLKFFDRIFGMGDIEVVSSDVNKPLVVIENVKNPESVKEMLYYAVQTQRKLNKVNNSEFVSGGVGNFDGIEA